MSGVKSREDRAVHIAAHLVMILLTVCALAPFILMVSSSLTDNEALARTGYRFFPVVFSTDAYEYIGREWAQVGNAYMVTIIVTVVGTIISLFLVSSMGYGLAQSDVPGLGIVFVLVLITMLFNGGVVASYIIYSNLFHIKNTIFALILPNLLLNGFNIMLVRNYMRNSIPHELLEAAEMDGAGQFRIYLTMVMPLSKPILATVGLLTAVGYWNDWTNGLYYITDHKLYSVQQLLDQMNKSVQYLASHSSIPGLNQNLPSTSIRMAIAVVGILPIIIAYPFFQKYFEKGIAVGAVKG